MNKTGIIQIHGNDYKTVAQRVKEFLAAVRKDGEIHIDTEVLQHSPSVVIKATIAEPNGSTFTGISSINLSSNKLIEKENPYEVAETSAVGRALGFGGYGLTDSIASADEMAVATRPIAQDYTDQNKIVDEFNKKMEGQRAIDPEFGLDETQKRVRQAKLKWLQKLRESGQITNEPYETYTLEVLTTLMDKYKEGIGK